MDRDRVNVESDSWSLSVLQIQCHAINVCPVSNLTTVGTTILIMFLAYLYYHIQKIAIHNIIWHVFRCQLVTRRYVCQEERYNINNMYKRYNI